MRFSRVVKPQDDAGGCSIDAVFMQDSAGPVHTHTLGEACLCFPNREPHNSKGAATPGS